MTGARLALLSLALVAGCGGAGGWGKAGADATAAQREYQDCQAMAGAAVRTEADIDQDIRATRGADIQRGAVVRGQSQLAREHTRDRAASIIAACMQGKGFSEAK